ncbi:FecR domain-containing protein [Chitinophaga sp.]|uniref:FecR family protein n=1 Tax=Chitinophaga sp. TaxID=1869181 RepID=UPI0031D5633B
MPVSKLKYLLEKHFNKSSTPAEKEELAALLLQAEQDEELKAALEEAWQSYAPAEELPETTADRLYAGVLEQAGGQPVIRRLPLLRRRWLRYAAAVVMLLGVGAFFWLRPQKTMQLATRHSAPARTDVAPGRPGAVLTLADGTEVVLDSLGNGLIATQSSSSVVLQNGVLAYNTANAADGPAVYNTMTTPRGRQFRLLLPDGSLVWLNADSKIKYPAVFAGNERKVEITGEAYFEVAKNAAMPFRVQINERTEVEVLGTHFNINSYEGEAGINTTLLEGSVRVTAGGEQAVLQAGEQAQVNSRQLRVVKHVDVNRVMAWKNGYFQFGGMDLPAVMREISRWYDVEITYKGKVPQKEFAGEIPRSISLKNLLRLIEFGDVRLEVSGNQVTIIGQ